MNPLVDLIHGYILRRKHCPTQIRITNSNQGRFNVITYIHPHFSASRLPLLLYFAALLASERPTSKVLLGTNRRLSQRYFKAK